MRGQRNVAVIGVGETAFRTHHADLTYVELAQQAALAALAHAGMTPEDIDAVVFSMAPTQFAGVNDSDKWAVDSIFGAGRPFMRINTGGATGGSAFHAGYSHIASGLFRTVLVVGADRVAETPDTQHILNLIWDRFYERDFALNTVTMTALAAQRYMSRYGAREEDFAGVVVQARRRPRASPRASEGGDYSRGCHGVPAGVMAVQALRHLPALFWCGGSRALRWGDRAEMKRSGLPATGSQRSPTRLHGRPDGALVRYRIRRSRRLRSVARAAYGRRESSTRQRKSRRRTLRSVQPLPLSAPRIAGFRGRGEAARHHDEGAFDGHGDIVRPTPRAARSAPIRSASPASSVPRTPRSRSWATRARPD